MVSNAFTERLGIQHPIVQAPMAGGHTTSDLVSAVSNAGALGGLGAGALAPEAITKTIREIRAKTDAPFVVNHFVIGEFEVDSAQIARTQKALEPIRKELGIETPAVPTSFCEDERAQMEASIQEAPPAVSFTFGIPDATILQRFKNAGTTIIGTATTVAEAIAWEQAGADALCLQGIEAGGHRGTFLDFDEAQDIGTLTLVADATRAVSIPCIAAGGIMDGRALAAALAQGALGAQLGTAFLCCDESGTPPHWKAALQNAGTDATENTRAFSGRPARGLTNTFSRSFRGREADIAPYPIQNKLTKDIRKASAQQDAEYFSYWAGQGVSRVRPMSVAKLIDVLMKELKESLP